MIAIKFRNKKLMKLAFTVVFLSLFMVSLYLSPSMNISNDRARSARTTVEDDHASILQDYLFKGPLDIKMQSGTQDNESLRLHKIWEPNIAQASIHAVAVSADKSIIAAAGGYLKDNEIHVYVYDNYYKQIVHLEDLGDGIIQNDIQSLAIDDLDGNGYYEIVAGSSDGHIYVFEQMSTAYGHSPEYFVHTWTSPDDYMRVWSVTTDELDGDGDREIIAGCWDGKVHVLEYVTRGGFPWTEGHWQEYREVWNSSNLIQDKVYSVATGDTDEDGFREIIVGDASGNVYIFENGNKEKDQPYPYHYNDMYYLAWNRTMPFAKVIQNLKVHNLDNDTNEEIVLSSYGCNVYFIDYSSTLGYTYSKVFDQLETWESGGFWPLDPYVDKSITNFSINVIDSAVFPYNTSLAGSKDGNYALFNASKNPNATVVVDFGKDQEITGDGNNTADLYIWLYVVGVDAAPPTVNATDYELYASNDLVDFFNLENATIDPVFLSETTNTSGGHTYYYHYYRVEIDLDPALLDVKLPYFRYLKLVVKGIQDQYIDALRGTLNLPLTEVTSMTIGNIDFSASSNDPFKDKLILGTSDGRLLVYQYNRSTDSEIGYDGAKLVRFWDSFVDDRFSVGDAIWALELLNETGFLPTWRFDQNFGVYNFSFDYGDIIGDPTYDIVYGSYEIEGIVPDYYGVIRYRANLGTNKVPIFGAEERINPEETAPYKHMLLAPTLVDIDGDEDLDVVVGYANYYTGEDPDIDLWRNLGSGVFMREAGMFASLYYILKLHNGTPYLSFYDMDGDGDYDLTLGHTDLYYFENTGNSSIPNWTYRSDFYKSLNEQTSTFEDLRKAAFSDFDKDGDIDVTVSINYTFVSPVVNYSYTTLAYFENKGTLHNPTWMRNKNLYETDFQFHDNALLKDLDGDNNLDLIAKYTFKGTFENRIFTYLSYFDHNAIFAATYPRVMLIEVDKSNSCLGYEANIAWDNSPQMDEWSFAVEIADTDDDGNKEVIIGSFDNNIYTFENLFNNTYRRAWRSQDLKNLETSGSWNYYIWDDVKDLVIDDTDEDGIQEIIAVAGEKVYVFENIGDDNYSLVWTYEFSEEGYAIDTGADLDNDGRLEIIVATQSASNNYLYVLECQGDNNYALVWSYNFPYTTDGSYYRYTVPNAIATEDLDNDGNGEIIVAGYNETRYSNGDRKGTNDGFLWVFEAIDNDNYTLVWHAPQDHFDENPANYLIMGDNDENGKLEIAVGCTKGVIIYESTTNDQFSVIEVITSSATYPEINATQVVWNLTTTIANPEIVQLGNGSFVAVYVKGNMLYSAFSADGSVWTEIGRVTTDNGQTYESQPFLTVSDNYVYLLFKSDRTNPSNHILWLTYSVNGGANWSTPEDVPVNAPAESPARLSDRRTITYIVPNNGIYKIVWYTQPTGYWGTPVRLDIPVNSTQLEAVSHEVLKLSDGTYALVMDGWNKSSTKHDMDIWLFLSQDFENWSQPIRVTSSYSNETSPAIAELEKGVLMITYTSDDGYIKVKVSTNGGLKWSDAQNLEYAQNTATPSHLSVIGLKNGGYMYAYTNFDQELIGGTIYSVYRVYVMSNAIPNWWYYSVNNVNALAYGNLDNDNSNEIIIGAEKRVSVFEYNQTLGRYNLTWISELLDSEIVDMAIGDTNDNELDEVVVTAKGGYVYSYELADKDPPNIKFAEQYQNKLITVGDLTVKVYAEDQGRIDKVQVKIDDGNWICAMRTGENDFEAIITFEKQGVYTIKAKAIDHIGLCSAEISVDVIVVWPEKTSQDEDQVLQEENNDEFNVYQMVQVFSVMALVSIITIHKYRKKK